MKMRIPAVFSCLVAGCLFSFSLSFAQTSSPLPPAVPEETVELQPLTLIDSRLQTTTTVDETQQTSADSQAADSQANGKGSGSATKRTKVTGSPTGEVPASTAYVFPTSGQMNRYWLKNTLGLKPILGSAFTASWNTWVTNSPSEWGKDATGWGKRYGASLLDNGINTATLVWISRATGRDPRYHRCGCTGLRPRSRHAIQMAFMSYNRSGSLRFSPAKVVSPFAGRW